MTPEEKILFELHRSPPGIADDLLFQNCQISRTDLTTSLNFLRDLGFVIESHPRHGHRLLESPNSLIPDDLRARLRNRHGNNSFLIGNHMVVFQQTDSTNDVVQKLGAQGHPAGMVVFAETQTAGRGRHARTWISPHKKGLWFTVLLRPVLSLQSASRLTVMTAVAVARALRRVTRLPLCIKWPNDILCRGRKLAGILLELTPASEHVDFVALGIGINVNVETADLPRELQTSATSLKIESNTSWHLPSLATELLYELEMASRCIDDTLFPKLLEAWAELDKTTGTQVSVLAEGRPPLRGLALNLDHDGALMVRTDSGQIEKVIAGDVTLEKMR